MTPNLLLRDRVALITGAATGIGEATAELFTAQGAHVILSDRDADRLRATAARIAAAPATRDAGGSAEAVVADIGDTASVAALTRAALRHSGRVDVLVNNAGVYPRQPFLEMTEDQWDEIQNINLKGSYRCARALAPVMVERGGGVIINTASVTFHVGMAAMVHYVASKGGIVGLTRALARELGPLGVRVNCISPGAIKTENEKFVVTPEQEQGFVERQCLKRRLLAPDVARVALFLASDLSAGLTGQTINVDGGWALA